ncbi:MAG: group II intron maturase-specific domain-containing protein [Gammaproteobacteria bacterium]
MRRSPLGCGGHSVQTVIASLNPILKGWYGYFQHAHRFTEENRYPDLGDEDDDGPPF